MASAKGLDSGHEKRGQSEEVFGVIFASPG